MRLEAVMQGPLENNAYLLVDEEACAAVAVDPALESAPWFLQRLKALGARLRWVVNTHGHYDHIADNAALQKATGARVCVHRADRDKLLRPSSPFLGGALPQYASCPDRLLEDGEVVEAGALALQVLHTPGHSPGSVCLFEEQAGLLFSGDTVFAGGEGRTDFADSSPQAMAASLHRLLALPDAVRVLPGHRGARFLGDEKPWMRRAIARLRRGHS